MNKIGKSIRKTLKKVGFNLSSSSPTRPSPQTNTLEQLKSIDVPTTNVTRRDT
jgi:hypothetical protein